MARLYGRNRLLQTLLVKEQFEEDLGNLDKSQWYGVNLDLVPSEIRSSFVQMDFDDETEQFLNYCRDVSDSICLQLFYDIASFVLGWFYTKTCVNGILGRGIMFIFSTAHLSRLFSNSCDDPGSCVIPFSSLDGAVLDLGAGDGTITEKYRPYFHSIYATEASSTMRRRLQDRGTKLLSIDEWWRVDDDAIPRFQLISCLNLLDRHTKPLTLLGQLHSKAKTDGALVLLAVVLPWSQYVEYQVENAGRDGGPNQPLEVIRVNGSTFEAQLADLVASVLNPAGFKMVRWTRLPYLCEGDMYRSLYWLDDAVLLLKPV